MTFTDFYRLLRSRLRSWLCDSTIDVRFGKRFERFTTSVDTKSVTAYFTDGSSVTGRLLIGADGSRSEVRTHLVGRDKASLDRLPFAATFINASYSKEQALFLRSYHPLMSGIFHPNNYVGMMATLDAPDPNLPDGWSFTFYISWNSTIEEQDAESAVMGVSERLQQVKRKAADEFADPLKSAFAWLPDDHDKVYHSGVADWDPSLEEHLWDNHSGLVTLVGDAAHAMTYRK
jgi:2-polyprenyl-6-methoxyphenol hydroxylase-like FAD-dependent oxidoreductase